MRKIRFDEDEMIVIAIFKENSRKETITSMEEALKVLKEKGDVALYLLMNSVLFKIQHMSDREFGEIDLEDTMIPEEGTDEEAE